MTGTEKIIACTSYRYIPDDGEFISEGSVITSVPGDCAIDKITNADGVDDINHLLYDNDFIDTARDDVDPIMGKNDFYDNA